MNFKQKFLGDLINMKWLNKSKELSEFAENWKNVKEFSIFGFGAKCKNFSDASCKEFKILRFYDNDKALIGQSLHGANVLHSSEVEKIIKSEKILISTHYSEISKQLKNYGLVEDIDFCEMDKFASVYYWFNYRKIHISRLNIALTTRCTLNCKHCNMFVPYYKDKGQGDVDLSELITDTKLFFDFIDKTYLFCILGGETFLHPYLKDYLNFLCKNYREKIIELRIVTNATILPCDELISLIKKYDVIVQISDYSNIPGLVSKLFEFESKLKEANVKIIKPVSSTQWFDHKFPHNPLDVPENKLIKHMHECAPCFKGINGGKFYYCHIVWAAVKAGLLTENSADYIGLADLNPNNPDDKIKLIEYDLGYMDNGYVSLCRFCAGINKNNAALVEAAIQAPKYD